MKENYGPVTSFVKFRQPSRESMKVKESIIERCKNVIGGGSSHNKTFCSSLGRY